VLGDPANSNDPKGLCSVIGSGITQSAYSDSTSAQQEFADEVGGISVTPYSYGTLPGGVANVAVQGLGIPTSPHYRMPGGRVIDSVEQESAKRGDAEPGS
jgi:hypothetical protein